MSKRRKSKPSGSTCSPVSADGTTRCSSPDGRQRDLFGQEVVPVSRSRRRGSGKGKTTTVTSGRICTGSSRSNALQSCLVNRLMTRLPTGGWIGSNLIWKSSTTPLGLRFYRLAVSGRIKSAKEFSGWVPTPRHSMGTHMIAWARAERGEHRSQLEDWLASKWLADGGQRESGLHVCPRLCATLMGYPESWLDSAMPLCRP